MGGGGGLLIDLAENALCDGGRNGGLLRTHVQASNTSNQYGFVNAKLVGKSSTLSCPSQRRDPNKSTLEHKVDDINPPPMTRKIPEFP